MGIACMGVDRDRRGHSLAAYYHNSGSGIQEKEEKGTETSQG